MSSVRRVKGQDSDDGRRESGDGMVVCVRMKNGRKGIDVGTKQFRHVLVLIDERKRERKREMDDFFMGEIGV